MNHEQQPASAGRRGPHAVTVVLGLVTVLALGAGCSSEEAPRITLPVAADASATSQPASTDLGYRVVLTRARAALHDLQFTVGGETHLAILQRLQRWIVPLAHAHPGHAGGGEVLGELPGKLLVDWMSDGAVMGSAVMLAAKYQGANFGFRRAEPGELPPGDSLAGHTFAFEGTASRGGRTLPFTALVDIDPTATVIGAPFDHEVVATRRETLGLRLLPGDPTGGGDTIWNQIDFHALPGADADIAVIAAPHEAHNFLARALRSHDHYEVTRR
jgi:hypothetical protein